MTDKQIRAVAKEESTRLVDDLRKQNERSPQGSRVPDEAYERLRRLAERKIVSLARAD